MSQTIGNEIVVLPDGTVVDFFTRIDTATNGTLSSFFAVVRSTDDGATWSAPIQVAANLGIGTKNAKTGQAVRDGGLTQSTDGVHWQESRIAPPFDLELAPDSSGLFLGDYEALISTGGAFVPF